jgi:CheY-like chemotaxis protein
MTQPVHNGHENRLPRKQILVIEDSVEIRVGLSALLKLENYDVVVSEDGQAGLNYLNSAKVLPHLILLDLLMPVKDGYEFLEEKKANPRFDTIPVIIMTANQMQDAKSLGTEGFLRKPLVIDLLIETIESILTVSEN